MSLSKMRPTIIGLTALAFLAVDVPGAVAAYPPFACQQIPSAPIPTTVCAGVSNGQVSGSVLYIHGGQVTWDGTRLLSCNSTGGACTTMPGSRVQASATPKLPATPGATYLTCTSFHVRIGLLDTRYYSGCSPLVAAFTG